jgi:hypothetical protein
MLEQSRVLDEQSQKLGRARQRDEAGEIERKLPRIGGIERYEYA